MLRSKNKFIIIVLPKVDVSRGSLKTEMYKIVYRSSVRAVRGCHDVT